MGATILGASSGIDDVIFAELRARNALTGVMDARLPAARKIFCLATSFKLRKEQWYHAWYGKMLKSPGAFRARTRVLDRDLRSKLPDFDVLLQVGGQFAPFEGEFPKPVTLFVDYTTKLAELNYPPWFRMSKSSADRWYQLETELYQKCAVIFTASQNTQNSLSNHYGVPPDRIEVVREGVHQVTQHPGKRYDECTILFVGIDFERKGGDALLKAFTKVKKHLPKARLLVVGPTARQSCEGVVWLGHIAERGQMEQLYSESTLFCMPSVCEPFGLSMIEAMAHGLPVVGSTSDAMPEIVEDGKNGYLVAPGDVDSLADRLVRLLSSPDHCADLGWAGRDRVLRQFLWERVIDEIQARLRQVCHEERGWPGPAEAEKPRAFAAANRAHG